MPPKSDLLDLSRLNVEFAGGAQDTVQTIYIRPDRRKIAGPPRKIPVQSTWHREIELGHGGGGRVYLEKCTECTHDNVQGQVGQLRAVKRLLKQPKVDYSRELEAVALFSHERFRESFVESYGWYDNDDFVFITMEYLVHGDLQAWLKRPLPEMQAQIIMLQVIEALKYMHNHDFTHRDLKPGNILVVTPGPYWWVKLADFGISKRVQDGNTALRTQSHTPGYIAPEILHLQTSSDEKEIEKRGYTNAVDMWCAGVVACVVLLGQGALASGDIQRYVIGRDERFPEELLVQGGISTTGQLFLQALLSIMPQSRPTAHDCLDYEWLKNARNVASQLRDEADSPHEARYTDNVGKPLSLCASTDGPSDEVLAPWTSTSANTMDETSNEVLPLWTTTSANTMNETSDEVLALWTTTSANTPDSDETDDLKDKEREEFPASSINRMFTDAVLIDDRNMPRRPVDEAGKLKPQGHNLTSAKPHRLIAARNASLHRFGPSDLDIAASEKRWHVKQKLMTSGQPLAMDYSVRGDFLAIALSTGVVLLWSLNSSTAQELRGHSRRATSVRFPHGGHIVASCADDSTVRIWLTSTGQQRQSITTHHAPTKIVVARSGDFLACVWQAEHQLAVSRLHNGAFSRLTPFAVYGETMAMEFSPDEQTLICVLKEGSIVWINHKTGGEARRFKMANIEVVCAAISRSIACSTADGRIVLWHYRGSPNDVLHTNLPSRDRFEARASHIAIAPDRRTLASVNQHTTSDHGTFRHGHLWDSSFSRSSSLQSLDIFGSERDRAWNPRVEASIAFSSDSEYVAFATSDGVLLLQQQSSSQYSKVEVHDVTEERLRAESMKVGIGDTAEVWRAAGKIARESPDTRPKRSFKDKIVSIQTAFKNEFSRGKTG